MDLHGQATTGEIGAAALVVGRLRAFLRQPNTAADYSAAARWLDRFPGIRRRRPVATTLWELSEGDELEDGHIVLHVRRDPRASTVQVVTSEPATTAELPADAPVTVIRA